ncbi:hypothetical protein PVAND_014899 [Polypedilum vanderplanki]|uniref:Uncharacterized protein n=1 Tax=Polypedilum vanderplanki TaxID=319348 RepID=A0A9J6BAP7_POLVA|nr:hypothetical protein PVAND_014899 [Polypedilum vanderplanki]
MRVKKETVSVNLELTAEEIAEHTYKLGDRLIFIPIKKTKHGKKIEGKPYSELFKPKLLALMHDCKKLVFQDYFRKSGNNHAAYILCSHSSRISISYKNDDLKLNNPLNCSIRSSCSKCFPELALEDQQIEEIQPTAHDIKQTEIKLLEVSSSVQARKGIETKKMYFVDAMQTIQDNIMKELHSFEAFCYQQPDPLQALYNNKPLLGLQVNSAVINTFVTPLFDAPILDNTAPKIRNEKLTFTDATGIDKTSVEKITTEEISSNIIEYNEIEIEGSVADKFDCEKDETAESRKVQDTSDETPKKDNNDENRHDFNPLFTPNTELKKAEEMANKVAIESGGGMILRSIKPKTTTHGRKLFEGLSPRATKNRLKQQDALKNNRL